MAEYNCKNYTEQGGEVTHIGGSIVFDAPLLENQAASTATTVAAAVADLNALLVKLKAAGLMAADAE